MTPQELELYALEIARDTAPHIPGVTPLVARLMGIAFAGIGQLITEGHPDPEKALADALELAAQERARKQYGP